MALRLCVQRYGHLPTAITVDGGPEFASVYFEQLLALYRVRKHQRPAAEPRFGGPQERLFGSMQSEFLYHLLGNTQATQQPRQMTKATDPRRHAVWTLPALAERVQQWADEESYQCFKGQPMQRMKGTRSRYEGRLLSAFCAKLWGNWHRSRMKGKQHGNFSQQNSTSSLNCAMNRRPGKPCSTRLGKLI